ncbi:MAG TPA: uroporphyrinogen decarboxylase family protein [Candidatus Acidoferrum sp.]|jgi:MtaA/CmuA family methyltransferase|nr:uroporphyrinogen decarboxylase family protein [Candidatus Acidoferrum sp.]
MIDGKTADRELQTYIRPQTFPVAIRMLKPGEPIPEKARRPARDFKKLSMNCQVIDMARRYGWMIALTREDHICSLGIAALGFEKPTHLHASGTLCEGMYTETKEAGQRSEAAVDRFRSGEYYALLVAPLDRATFEPHLVCIYANPAQVMRLTQAALWKRGGKLASSFGGRIDCSEIIVTTMRTDQPQVILPCSGDRIFGQTQDHEMAFTIPWGQMDEIIEGLRGTHDGGIRYPITQFMEYEAKLPPKYMEANRVWDVQQGKASYSNRDRVVAAYKRSFADRVPVYPIVASFAGTLDGLSIEEYCTNPTRAITAMMNYYERYQPDVVLAYNDLAKEAEAFGCRVKYSDYVVPSIDQHVLQENKADLAKLVMPDPYKTARLPGFIEQCEALVKAKPPTAIGAVAVGPWTIAMLLRNPETMLLDTFEDPQFIHDVMRVATDFCKIYGDAIVKTGIGLSFSEPTASISLISPDNYRDFVAPYHKELVEYFKAKKVGVTTHICGTTYPIFEDLLQCGFTTVSFDLDQQGDPTLYVDQLARFMEVAKGRAVAIGNVDATKFEKTSREAMYADVKRCIDAAARRSGFILSTSCEIPPRSEPEIVKWFMDAAHEYGRYERLFS